MSLASNKDSHSLGQGSLQLLVELIDTDSVHEVADVIVVFFALEDHCDVESNKDVVVGWTGSYRELVDDILLCHQELNFGPRKAEHEASLFLDMIELAMLRNDSVCSFRSVFKWLMMGEY